MLPRPSSVGLVRVLRSTINQAPRTASKHLPIRTTTSTSARVTLRHRIATPCLNRSFHLSSPCGKGISPESPDPTPKAPPETKHATEPASISSEDYHKAADEYFDDLVHKLEQMQEEKGDMDSEYSAGVLNISFPPVGTYVLNKQPPNKQIWLSSPTSGPKRFDYVVSGESMNEKEGSGSYDWVYLRDGTRLSELLRKELGVDMSVDHDAPR